MQAIVRKERWPGGYYRQGNPLVRPGQEVLPDQPVLRMRSAREGQADVEELLPAGLRGRVVEITERGGVVIESRVTQIRGCLGSGSQVAGVLTLWLDKSRQAIPPGAILVTPGQLTFNMLRRAIDSGVTGIVAGSSALRDFEGFLRVDLVQLLSSVNVESALAHLPPLTIMLTEGIGSLRMPDPVLNQFGRYQGSIVLLSGLTSVRWNVFPDLSITTPPDEARARPVQPFPLPLTFGMQVRVRGGEYQGTVGTIDYLFVYPQVFPSGIRARAVRLALPDKSSLMVPQLLVEAVE